MFNENLFAKLESGKGYNATYKDEVLNPYVNFHKHQNTQSLSDALIAESIQMRGVEFYYIRRQYVDIDFILGEDPKSRFEKAYKVAMYIASFDGYQGQREFFTKFGMQVNDELNLQINPPLFRQQADGEMPLEGDLIYFPMGNSLFEVTWVETNDPFYQVGYNGITNITATKFIYSGEDIGSIKVKSRTKKEDPTCGLNLEELTTFDDTGVVEFEDDPVLDPIKKLNGYADVRKDQYIEDQQFKREGDAFIDPDVFDPIIGKGITYSNPFDDF